MSLQHTLERSRRAAILGQLLQTFPTERERISLIQALRQGNIISSSTAEMLHEIYGEGGAL